MAVDDLKSGAGGLPEEAERMAESARELQDVEKVEEESCGKRSVVDVDDEDDDDDDDDLDDDDEERKGPIREFPSSYQFLPEDDELIVGFLRPRLEDWNCKLHFEDFFHYVNFADYHPQELAEKYRDYGKDRWYFFTRKHLRGSRSNRKTKDGYWKATGSEKPVNEETEIDGKMQKVKVGSKKSLVFYLGKGGSGQKTDWIMHEYENFDESTSKEAKLDQLVLCTIQRKRGSSSSSNIDDRKGTSRSRSPKRPKLSRARKSKQRVQVPEQVPPLFHQSQQQRSGGGHGHGHGQVVASRAVEFPAMQTNQGMDQPQQGTLLFPLPRYLQAHLQPSASSSKQFYRPSLVELQAMQTNQVMDLQPQQGTLLFPLPRYLQAHLQPSASSSKQFYRPSLVELQAMQTNLVMDLQPQQGTLLFPLPRYLQAHLQPSASSSTQFFRPSLIHGAYHPQIRHEPTPAGASYHQQTSVPSPQAYHQQGYQASSSSSSTCRQHGYDQGSCSSTSYDPQGRGQTSCTINHRQVGYRPDLQQAYPTISDSANYRPDFGLSSAGSQHATFACDLDRIVSGYEDQINHGNLDSRDDDELSALLDSLFPD